MAGAGEPTLRSHSPPPERSGPQDPPPRSHITPAGLRPARPPKSTSAQSVPRTPEAPRKQSWTGAGPAIESHQRPTSAQSFPKPPEAPRMQNSPGWAGLPGRVGQVRPPGRVGQVRQPGRMGPPARMGQARPPGRVGPARPPGRVGQVRQPGRVVRRIGTTAPLTGGAGAEIRAVQACPTSSFSRARAPSVRRTSRAWR